MSTLRELEAAATPRPWRGEVVGSEGAMVYPPRPMRGWVARVTNRTFAEDQANTALITALRNAAPLLLDVVDAARSLDSRFFDGKEDWSRVGLPGEVDDLHDALDRLDSEPLAAEWPDNSPALLEWALEHAALDSEPLP